MWKGLRWIEWEGVVVVVTESDLPVYTAGGVNSL